jgi:hypothetical protein
MADEPDDDDDARLRKRVGVLAGYLTIAAPLSLPIQAQGHPLSWLLALGLALSASATCGSSGRRAASIATSSP